MKPEPAAITGGEDWAALSPDLRALSQFYRAFNQRDLVALESNWLQGDEIAMDNPLGGIMRGWGEVASIYAHLLHGPAQVHAELWDYTIIPGSDMFCAVGRERGSFDLGRDSLRITIRTSRIYKRAGGEWKQVHYHGSIGDPELLRCYQEVVGYVGAIARPRPRQR